ncbi:MAG: GMP synthase [Candidatus Tectimicrobiota bacterium]|nr:MAG: GMP synthase [Candidatus Tectomicrobia bacterium]
MKTALAIRHVPFEDLGSFAAVLAEAGFAVTYLEAGLDDLQAVAPLAPDLLVVLGGPIGAYEEDAYPFLRHELALLERRLAAGRPTLGICLGCQLMARALGARVYPGPRKEIGWAPLQLTEAGRRSCLASLAETPVLHWHGDTFDLPAGATRLASTPLYANQAFAWGEAALGLQFHLEVTAQGLERWFIGHACEIGATAGLSVVQLRADTARWAPRLAQQGPACLRQWLQQLYAASGGTR